LKALAIAVVMMLSLSVVFASMAFHTPVAKPPVLQRCPPQTLDKNGDPIMSSATSVKCGSIKISNDLAMGSYTTSLGRYQMPAEMSESFLALAVICSFGLIHWRVPAVFRRRVNLPKAVSMVGLAMMVAGLTVFALSAMLDISSFDPQRGDIPGPTSYPALYYSVANLADALGLHSIVVDWIPASSVQGYGHFGLSAFAGFAVAVVGFTVFRARRGITNTLRDGVLLAAALLFLLELGLVTLDREFMVMQVANVVALRVASVPIVSNWFVLIVSSGLLALGLAHGKLGFAASGCPCLMEKE
jgi:hypothetical protein